MAEADNDRGRYEQVFHSKPGEQAPTAAVPAARPRLRPHGGDRGDARQGQAGPPAGACPRGALMPDLEAFRPTFILAVPYLFEKVFRGARRKAETEGKTRPVRQGRRRRGPVRGGAWSARRSAPDRAPAPRCGMQHQVFDRLVYSKLRDGHGRPGAARHVRRLRHGTAARAVLRRRGHADLRGLRTDRIHGGCRGQPARAAPASARWAGRYPARRVHIAEDGEVCCTAARSSPAI